MVGTSSSGDNQGRHDRGRDSDPGPVHGCERGSVLRPRHLLQRWTRRQGFLILNRPCGSGEYAHNCLSRVHNRQGRQEETHLLRRQWNDSLSGGDRDYIRFQRWGCPSPCVLPPVHILPGDLNQRGCVRAAFRDVSQQGPGDCHVHSRTCSLGRHIPCRSVHAMVYERADPCRNFLPLYGDVRALYANHVETRSRDYRPDLGRD